MKTFTAEHCTHTFELCRAKCRPCSGLDKGCPDYTEAGTRAVSKTNAELGGWAKSPFREAMIGGARND